MSHLQQAISALANSTQAYVTADSYLKGTNPELFSSRRMARILRAVQAKYRLNYARVCVTAVLDRLEITSVSATASPQANAALQVIWTENHMDLWGDDLHRDALTFGDAYLHVWPDENGFPGLHPTSPLNARIVYSERHGREKKFAVNSWIEEDRTGRVDLYYPDRVERYVTKKADGELPLNENEWIPFLDEQNDEDGILENPFGAIPFFHFRTARPYGDSEMREAFGAQDAVNKHVITQVSSIDTVGFPQRYLLSEAGNGNVGGSGALVDDDDWDDDTGSAGKGDNGNVQSGAQGGPGTILEFVGKSQSIGQFSAADQKAFLEPMSWYVEQIASLTSTPMHLFRSIGGLPSGSALRAILSPLIKKVERRQRSFGSTWDEALSFALQTVGIDSDVTLGWADPYSEDSKEEWEIAQAKIEAGIPFEVVMTDMGYSAEEIAAWGPATGVATPSSTMPIFGYDLDAGVVTIDERRAQLSLPPMPNGAGAQPPITPGSASAQPASTGAAEEIN